MNRKHSDDEVFLKMAQLIEQNQLYEKLPDDFNQKIRSSISEKIKKDSIQKPHRFFSKKLTVAAAITLFLITIVPLGVYASLNTGWRGIFVNNPQAEQLADTYVNIQEPEVDGTESSDSIVAVNSSHIDITQLPEGWPIAEVTDIALPQNDSYWPLETMVLSSSSIAVFTQNNDSGWYLQEGDQLLLKIEIDPNFSNADGTGETIVFGYTLNQFPHIIAMEKNTNFSFVFTAPQTGYYFPFLENGSPGYLKINSGKIELIYTAF